MVMKVENNKLTAAWSELIRQTTVETPFNWVEIESIRIFSVEPSGRFVINFKGGGSVVVYDSALSPKRFISVSHSLKLHKDRPPREYDVAFEPGSTLRKIQVKPIRGRILATGETQTFVTLDVVIGKMNKLDRISVEFKNMDWTAEPGSSDIFLKFDVTRAQVDEIKFQSAGSDSVKSYEEV
jgi:hypothetical protein